MTKLNLIKKGLLSNVLNIADLSKLKGGGRRKVSKPTGGIPPPADLKV